MRTRPILARLLRSGRLRRIGASALQASRAEQTEIERSNPLEWKDSGLSA